MAGGSRNENDSSAHGPVQRIPAGLCLPEWAGNCAEAIHWVAGVLRKGLTQVYAIRLSGYFDTKDGAPLVEPLRRNPSESAKMDAGEEKSSPRSQAEPLIPGAILEPLRTSVLERVDCVLEQAEAVGRGRAGVHLVAARFGDQVIILADHDPQQTWLLPTARARLRETLAGLGVYPTAAETQELDLQQGDVLQFLGVEFRSVRDGYGTWCIQYQPIPELAVGNLPADGITEVAFPADVKPTTPQLAPAQHPAGKRLSVRASKPTEPESQTAEQASTDAGRTPPVRWYFRLWPRGNMMVRRDGTGVTSLGDQVRNCWRRTFAVKVAWRHLFATLYLVAVFTVGWNTFPAWLCVSLWFAFNWRSVTAAATFAWQNGLYTTAAICGCAGFVWLYYLLGDVYTNVSREIPAPHLPGGFFLGQYNPSWFGSEPVSYGLYVPPHFEREPGLRPLLVFLHGYGERNKPKLMSMGLPQTIQAHFGEHSKNGRFNFVLFLPIDPTGRWQARTPEVDNVMKTLEYVIRRHKIDPARVYLTGLSSGGNGVWQLAGAYPDKWAAVAPVSALISPDIGKVRHIPTWIFHATHDRPAPVERDRQLFQKLKEAHADVRYTEVPVGGHVIWREAYDNRDLYDWFLQKTRH